MKRIIIERHLCSTLKTFPKPKPVLPLKLGVILTFPQTFHVDTTKVFTIHIAPFKYYQVLCVACDVSALNLKLVLCKNRAMHASWLAIFLWGFQIRAIFLHGSQKIRNLLNLHLHHIIKLCCDMFRLGMSVDAADWVSLLQ